MRALAVCRSVALRCQQKAIIAADAGRSYEAILKQFEVYRCASRDDSQVKNIQDNLPRNPCPSKCHPKVTLCFKWLCNYYFLTLVLQLYFIIIHFIAAQRNCKKKGGKKKTPRAISRSTGQLDVKIHGSTIGLPEEILFL